MAAPKPRTVADKLRSAGEQLLALADEFEIPSTTVSRSEILIGHVEDAAELARSSVRGHR